MNRPAAIVLVVDRLGANWLGPYGNTWIDTPSFNRLSSQSILWDFALAAEPSLVGSYRSFARGMHPLRPWSPDHGTLWAKLSQANITTTLITDDRQLRATGFISDFTEVLECEVGESGAAEEVEQTAVARLLAAVLDWLDQPRDSFCLWIHARGLDGAWDAPLEYRQRFVEEGDPPPATWVAPPNLTLEKDADPDLLLSFLQAHAAQVSVVDWCLGVLLDFLEERHMHEQVLLAVTSPRGYPLGERGGIGAAGDHLFAELLHVPLLVRRPGLTPPAIRRPDLVQSFDLATSLADWFHLPDTSSRDDAVDLTAGVPAAGPPRREAVISLLGDATAVRTPAWFLSESPERDPQLFVKPEDRWEVNEVAGRCREVLAELTQARRELCDWYREDASRPRPPLSWLLRCGFDR